MPVYTVTANTAVVAPDPATARRLAETGRWIIQTVQELPDEADGHAIVTAPEALHAVELADAWHDHQVEEARILADATWVGDAA